MSKWLVIFMGCLVLTSCSSSDDNNVPESGLDISSYYDEPGDVTTFNVHVEATYSNGAHVSQDLVTKEYCGEVGFIPPKYEYSGDISAPYTVCVETEDDEIDGFEYSSMQGEEIIEDDLETFKRIDAQTKTGSDEPDNMNTVNVGDEFTYAEDSTLFDSNSAEMVGSEAESGTLTVVSFETVSVPAGDYDTIKIDFTMNMSTTLHNITDTGDFSGSGWFDTATGMPVKMTGTLNMTLNEHGLTATATTERVLADFQPAANNANVQAMHLTTPAVLSRATIIKQIWQVQQVM